MEVSPYPPALPTGRLPRIAGGAAGSPRGRGRTVSGVGTMLLVMSAPRWLTDEEQDTWRTYLFATQLVQESLERQLQRDAGMPVTYYVVLAILSEAPDHALTMTRLAEITRSSPSRLSHAVARLEANGWVRRTPDPDNRRVTIASLTDTGHAVLVELAPGHVEQVRRSLFDPLTPEQVRQLRDILGVVLANLSPDACPPLYPARQP